MNCKASTTVGDPPWEPVKCELEEGHSGSHYAGLPYPKKFGAVCWNDETTRVCDKMYNVDKPVIFLYNVPLREQKKRDKYVEVRKIPPVERSEVRAVYPISKG